MNESPRKFLLVLCLAFGFAIFTISASAANHEIVAYRLINWKTLHFDDVQRAEIHANTLRRLGCDVRTGEHGGHIDVSYSCPDWREISLDSHDQAHTWEGWLNATGFETRHAH